MHKGMDAVMWTSLVDPSAPSRREADGDWRRFRELRTQARQQFAEETLAQALELSLDDDLDVQQRELALEALMIRRARERRGLFEDYNRDHLPLMLTTMLNQGLVQRDELMDLSLELKRALGLLD
ncbi:MAG: hypothetical protein AAGJ52_08560 [Pseudomonadota bacterium]